MKLGRKISGGGENMNKNQCLPSFPRVPCEDWGLRTEERCNPEMLYAYLKWWVHLSWRYVGDHWVGDTLYHMRPDSAPGDHRIRNSVLISCRWPSDSDHPRRRCSLSWAFKIASHWKVRKYSPTRSELRKKPFHARQIGGSFKCF